MANLLPQAERHAIQVERYRRFLNAGLGVAIGVCSIGVVLLVPSLVSVVASERGITDRLETTRQLLDRHRDAGASEAIVVTREKIDILAELGEKQSGHEVLDRVVNITPAGVDLQSVSVKHEEDFITVDVTGSAAERADLVAFGNALRSTGLFKEVVIPITMLASQTDLQFKLSLVLIQTP